MATVSLTVMQPDQRQVEVSGVTTAKYAACRVAEAMGLPSEPYYGYWALGIGQGRGVEPVPDDQLASELVGHSLYLGVWVPV